GCQFLGRRLISWQCKKQIVVATSFTEAEYVAAASCCSQVLKIHTDENVADLLTKAFDGPRFHYLASNAAGSTSVPAGVKQFWATVTVRTLEAGPSEIIATIDGNEAVVIESLIRTHLHLNDANGLYEFTLHDVLDGMREIGDGADAPVAGAAAANEVSPPPPPPHVPPTHTSSSTPGPSPAAQDTLVRVPTPVREPTPSPVREPTPFREATPDSLRHHSPPPYPRSEEVGLTTSTRPPSPTRQTSFHEVISEGGGDYVSLPKSDEALPTTAATIAGGAEDSASLTDLSLKLDRCINRVTTLENELGVTKKVLGGAVLKLVSRAKRLEGLLQQRKRRLVLSDSEGEEAATNDQDIDLDALHKMASTSLGGDTTVEAAYTIYKASQYAHATSDVGHAADVVPDDTTMPFRRTRTKRWRLRKTVTSSPFKHLQENISAIEDTILAVAQTIPAVSNPFPYSGDTIPAVAQTIPAVSTPFPYSGGVSASSSMDPADQAAAAAPSSTILAADKGKAPMVDDSLHVDLLTEQKRILKNLHDYQLGEDLAKKLHAEQEVEFARQHEELAQKAQAESVALPTKQGTWLSAQRRRELDAAQLIYTEADWLELMAKIATNTALSKQLLGDDVNENNMNERLGMLLMRKRRELAKHGLLSDPTCSISRGLILGPRLLWKHPLLRGLDKRPTPTLEAPSAKRARQEVPQDVHAASSQVSASVPAAAVSVPAAPSTVAAVSIPITVSVSAAPSVHADTAVDADESRLDDTQTASEHVSTTHTVAESTPSSSRTRRKQIAKKRVTPIVDVVDDALIKFDSASDSDDDPLPYVPYVGWEMVPSPLVDVVDDADSASDSDDDPLPYVPYVGWEMVPSPLGSIHAYYDMEGHTKHFTSLRELLHMVEKMILGNCWSLADADAHAFWRNQDSWRIRSWRLYPRAQFHVATTLTCMLKHGLEVPKLLVGGDLTMAKQLVSFIKAALLNAQSAV
nr:putative ribonuclease H-like domain-containing protein [Tanacetum cinerariifolium]